jgi:anti-anti-sigma factor
MRAMSETAENTNETSMLLPSRLCAETVEEICNEMRAAKLDRFKQVTLDFSQVDIFTSPGMQLVLALGKSLQDAGGKLAVSHVKPGVSQAMRDLGFEHLLPLH